MFRVTSTDMQSTATSMFSAYASFAAFMMMFRSLANDLVPEPVRSYLHSFLRYLLVLGPLSSTTTVVIVDEWGISRNDVYDAVDTYLRTKISPTTERFKVGKSPKQKSINLCFEKNQEINDTFDGGEVHLRWKFVSIEPKDDDYKEKTFFELSFNKKFKEKVLEEYLPYIMTKAREIEESDKVVKLYSGEGGSWGSINLDHSSSFETLAMEPVRDIIPGREFTRARSMVTLEEVGLAKKAATGEVMVDRDNPVAVAPIARGYGGSPATGKNQQRGSKGGGSDRGKNNSKRSNKSGSGRGGALVTLEEAGLAKKAATGAAMVARDNPVAVAPTARGYGGSPAIGKNQQRGSKGGGSDRGKNNSERSNKSGSGRGGALVTLEEVGLAKKAATGAAMVARDNPVAVAPTARGYGGSPAISKNQQRGSKGGGSDRGKNNIKGSNKSGSGRGGAHMTGGTPANPWQPPYGSAGQSPFGSAGQPQWNNGWAWVRRDGPRPLPEGDCFY